MNTIQSLIQAAATDTIPLNLPSSYMPVLADGNGVLYSKLVAGSAPILPVDAVNLTQDGLTLTTGIATGSANLGFNGATWDRVRIANVFKSVAATAIGNTTVWTPQSGKRFRLLAWRLSVAGTLAADGTQVIQLRDGGVTILSRSGANVAAALPSGDTQIGADYGGEGILGSAPNSTLVINLGTAMASGAVYIDVWGTEE